MATAHRLRSGFDELVVGPDAAVVVEDQDLEADGRHLAVAGAHISQLNLTTSSRRAALSRGRKLNSPGATKSSYERVTLTSRAACPRASREGMVKRHAVC